MRTLTLTRAADKVVVTLVKGKTLTGGLQGCTEAQGAEPVQ